MLSNQRGTKKSIVAAPELRAVRPSGRGARGAADKVGVPELLTTAEVAALLKVDSSTVCRWRSSGQGPKVTWLSPSIPRYQRAHLLEWLQAT